ncbi:MAG: AzlD domain-containing protein [Aquabacterium sp.]|jgi:branched-subunit amino acid transport protein|nr:MAG: AzlD domain-containing protein [Aquabacterium sp.]
MTDTWYTLAVVAGIAAVSVVNRSFFFISRREVPLPEALRRGLRYAPLAALIAVITPEIVMRNGALTTWNDARLYAALAAIAWHLYRPGMLGTIVVGMAAYLALRFGLGW